MIIKLDFTSKNFKSLEKIIKLFLNILYRHNIFNIKLLKKKSKTVFFSILKSPHVNKISQEQFEYKLHKTRLLIYTRNYLKILIILKNFSDFLLSDVKLKTIILYDETKSLTSQKIALNVCNGSSYLNYKDILGEKS